MADDANFTLRAPEAHEVCGYVEDMLMDLAAMASRAGETALAASLALVAIQAGAAKRRLSREA